MSFDAWIVGFGLSRAIIELKLLTASSAYGLWAIVIIFDLCLLYQYLVIGRFREHTATRHVPARSEPPPRRVAQL
jgi:uncharacterized protein